jgi:hypothetical protein
MSLAFALVLALLAQAEEIVTVETVPPVKGPDGYVVDMIEV